MEVAVIDQSGLVLSVVHIDDLSSYDPGSGLLALDAEGKEAYAGCMWTKSGGFSPPPKDEVNE